MDEADALCDRVAMMDHGQIVAEGAPVELIKQISGDVNQIRLSGDHIQQASAAMGDVPSALPFDCDVRLQDDQLYMYVADGTDAVSPVSEFLVNRDIRPLSLTVPVPSLDDVFLKLTGRSLRDVKGVS